MRVKTFQSFLNADGMPPATLLYGTNEALIQFRTRLLLQKLQMRSTFIAALAEVESAATGFFASAASKTCFIYQGVIDKNLNEVERLRDIPGALILTGKLKSDSKVLKFATNAPNIAVVPCYDPEGAELMHAIDISLPTLNPGLKKRLCLLLESDLGQAHDRLEQIALFAPQTDAEVEACLTALTVGDAGLPIFELAQAVQRGDRRVIAQTLARDPQFFDIGFIRLLLSMQNRKLRSARTFTQETQQLNAWLEAEMTLKYAPAPDLVIRQRLLS